MGSLPERSKTRLLLSISLLLSTGIDSILGFAPSHSTTATSRSFETRTCNQTAAPNPINQLPPSPLQLSQRTRLYSSSMNIQFSSTSFFLARIVFLRMLALVYGVAFWVARSQNKGLIGDNGITPCRYYLQQAKQRGQYKQEIRQEWLQDYPAQACFWNTNPIVLKLRFWCWDCSDRLNRPVTTLLWFCKNHQCLNTWLDRIALVGMACAMPILMTGTANVPLLLILWVCQRSVMAVGGPWYGYGWEPQLAELGFHALFLVPLWNRHSNMAPPFLVIYAIRWYLFKIMMGAGLIKLKSGDAKWKDLTAMDDFYETQPVPNPVSRYLHWYSSHKFEVVVNHFVEVVAPWLLLLPGRSRQIGGCIQIFFQFILIVSGNLSFLNWLTMVPAFLCLDDSFLQRFFRQSTLEKLQAAPTSPSLGRQVVTWSFAGLLIKLNVPVVKNLLARKQLMNASFDPLRLVNTYGAFGTINDDRKELIISSAHDIAGPWKEYEFQVKPGNVDRGTRFISPYHYRLDWQMWIAATIGRIERSPWIYNFLLQLLQRNKDVTSLLAQDPWANAPEPPKYIRIDVYRYKFHKPVQGDRGRQPYWDREYVKRFYPRQGIATVASLKDELHMQ